MLKKNKLETLKEKKKRKINMRILLLKAYSVAERKLSTAYMLNIYAYAPQNKVKCPFSVWKALQ